MNRIALGCRCAVSSTVSEWRRYMPRSVSLSNQISIAQGAIEFVSCVGVHHVTVDVQMRTRLQGRGQIRRLAWKRDRARVRQNRQALIKVKSEPL